MTTLRVRYILLFFCPLPPKVRIFNVSQHLLEYSLKAALIFQLDGDPQLLFGPANPLRWYGLVGAPRQATHAACLENTRQLDSAREAVLHLQHQLVDEQEEALRQQDAAMERVERQVGHVTVALGVDRTAARDMYSLHHCLGCHVACEPCKGRR